MMHVNVVAYTNVVSNGRGLAANYRNNTYPLVVKDNATATDDRLRNTVTGESLEDVEVTRLVMRLGTDGAGSHRVPHNNISIRTYYYATLHHAHLSIHTRRQFNTFVFTIVNE